MRGIHTQVAELRIELQSRGLPTSGLKAELVERLQAYWADWAEDAGASASTPSPAVPDSGSPRSHPPEATHEATPEEEEDSTPLTPDEEHEEALADAALDYAMSHAPQGHERAFEADGDTREQRATPGGTAGQGTEVERARRQLQNAQFRANKTSFDNVTGLELMFLVRRTCLPPLPSRRERSWLWLDQTGSTGHARSQLRRGGRQAPSAVLPAFHDWEGCCISTTTEQESRRRRAEVG